MQEWASEAKQHRAVAVVCWNCPQMPANQKAGIEDFERITDPTFWTFSVEGGKK
jgi:hypothetical protein